MNYQVRPEVSQEVVGDLTSETLEGGHAEEQLDGPLVAMDEKMFGSKLN